MLQHSLSFLAVCITVHKCSNKYILTSKKKKIFSSRSTGVWSKGGLREASVCKKVCLQLLWFSFMYTFHLGSLKYICLLSFNLTWYLHNNPQPSKLSRAKITLRKISSFSNRLIEIGEYWETGTIIGLLMIRTTVVLFVLWERVERNLG